MSALPWPANWLDRLLGRSGRAARADSPAAVDAAAPADARYGGEDDPEAEWITVFDAPGLEAAHVVKARLEAEDLPVALRYDTLSVVYGMTAGFGVKVQVPRALRDRAMAILSEDGVSSDWDAGGGDGEGEGEPGEDGRA